MFKFTIPITVASLIIGALIMGTTDLFWVPLFFFALGISIFLFNINTTYALFGLGICVILYVIVHFPEPQWINTIIKEVS